MSSILTNSSAMVALQTMKSINANLAKTTADISTGKSVASAKDNAAVLLAAQRGIRSARRRLAEIRTTASGLVTYDRSGRRAEVSESRNLAQRL